MKNDVFRQVSLERLSSPEQLDELISVAAPKAWIGLIAMGLLVISTLIWGFFGSIPTKMYGSGMLIKSGGIKNIVSVSEGQIFDVSVTEGEIVEKGRILARVNRRDIINQINILKETYNGYIQANNESEANTVKKKIELLQEEYEYSSTIVSPSSGKIIQIKIGVGDIIKTGESIFIFEPIDNTKTELDCVLYVQADQAKTINQGMVVNISPNSIPKEEYGYILGTVSSISDYPATQESMEKLLGNKELVKMFSSLGTVVEVRISLVRDTKNYSNYKWTSPSGPPLRINSGTFCSGFILLGETKPVNLVIP